MWTFEPNFKKGVPEIWCSWEWVGLDRRLATKPGNIMPIAAAVTRNRGIKNTVQYQSDYYIICWSELVLLLAASLKLMNHCGISNNKIFTQSIQHSVLSPYVRAAVVNTMKQLLSKRIYFWVPDSHANVFHQLTGISRRSLLTRYTERVETSC